MEPTGNNAVIEPVRLGLNSRIQFECHPKVSCFTACCRGINIILTPYDVIRLKRRLGLGSEEFLAIYTEPQILEKTDLPVVNLKLLDDEDKSCPFVRADGCIVYQDRPTSCRYYPLGMASLQHREGADDQGFYFMVREPHCKGHDESKTWTIAEFRRDQGVDVHDEVNADWTDLIVHKRSFPPNIHLTEKAKQMFFTVSYNIDQFRRFVFESSFLQRYEVDGPTLEAIKTDEIALFRFGVRWLRGALFKGVPDSGPALKSGAESQPGPPAL